MTNENLNTVIKNATEALKYPELYQNVSASERWLSGATGIFLLFKGIKNIFSHPVLGLTSAVAGAGLLYRGLTGYCPLKDYEEQAVANIPDEVIITETYVVDDLA
jgi:uncharacterized membrane protein